MKRVTGDEDIEEEMCEEKKRRVEDLKVDVENVNLDGKEELTFSS